MRALVLWIAAAAVGVGSCGRPSAKTDGGGHGGSGARDGGPATGGTPADAGGGLADGSGGLADAGGVDLPLSTGTFPYPGRWWANFPGTYLDGGLGELGPFVIHWNASDPADRALWNLVHVYPIDVKAGPNGSTIVMHAATGTSGCWALYPTSDPDALEAHPCDALPALGPVLGTFRRTNRLLAQIPLPPLPGPTSPQVKIPSGGIAGGGAWVVFGVDNELWLWKRDTGQVFDLGHGETYQVVVSPDGRRVMFTSGKPGAQILSLLVFDTATAEVTDLTAMVPITPAAQYTAVGIFSPDGSKVAFHANISIGGSFDLVVYDFSSREIVLTVPHLWSGDGRQMELFLASSDHLIYGGQDANGTLTSGPSPRYGYELSTGKTISFGEGGALTAIPGGAHAALQTSDGLVVIDDATFTPRVIASLTAGGGGLVPSPDGAEVAYVDGNTLKVRNLASGSTTLAVSDDAGCFGMDDPLAPAHTGASRSVAAIFAADGALVHEVGQGCGGGGVYGLGRYDRTTQIEKIYTPLADNGSILAVSPLGGMVIGTPLPPTVLAWPGPAATLDPGVPPPGVVSSDATFVFSAADRYLTYTTNTVLMVRDNQSGTVTQVAAIGNLKTFTNPVNGVTLVPDLPLTLYHPDGTSWSVGRAANVILANPETTKVAFAFSTNGTEVLPLEPGAMSTEVGNGFPLAITDTQVIFRDVDGVCAAPL